MPKKHKNRTMKGGFWNSLTQGFSDAWEKTKKATTDAYSSATGSPSSTYSPPTTTTTYSQPTTTTTYSQPTTTGYMGGKTKRRRMRGGFKDNTPTTGLANHAAPFSGKTAEPHNWVGGKTKRRKHRHSKSYRRRH